MPDTLEAPYGYTATGRVRKKPLKDSVPEKPLDPTQDPYYTACKSTRKKFKNCPACYQDFSYRPDPHRAVWQHLLHFATIAKDPKHQEARDTLKKIRDRKPTEEAKRQKEKVSAAEWRDRNPRKAKRASFRGGAKLKIERNLRREGKFSEEKLNKLLEDKMAEWDANN